MSDLGLSLPLYLDAREGSFKMIDPPDWVAPYVNVCAERERRVQTNRISPKQGAAVAKEITGALTKQLASAADPAE